MQTMTLRSVFSFLLLCLFCVGVRAQSGTGSITGRVFNASTKEYVRNAEIRVEGTNLVAYTDEGGFFRVLGVPAGQASVTVSYTGSQASAATLTVTPGQTATHDFELQPAAGKAGDSVVTLGAFVVASEREGMAKAIMERRASVN